MPKSSHNTPKVPPHKHTTVRSLLTILDSLNLPATLNPETRLSVTPVVLRKPWNIDLLSGLCFYISLQPVETYKISITWHVHMLFQDFCEFQIQECQSELMQSIKTPFWVSASHQTSGSQHDTSDYGYFSLSSLTYDSLFKNAVVLTFQGSKYIQMKRSERRKITLYTVILGCPRQKLTLLRETFGFPSKGWS